MTRLLVALLQSCFNDVVQPLEPIIQKVLQLDKKQLDETELPMVTVSASFKEDLKEWYQLPYDEDLPDIVFSRAHYSMALAIAIYSWQGKMNPKKAWVVDPTNYVSHQQWANIEITEFIGKTLARQPILKMVKDFVDKFGRNKLPILKSITPSLLFVTADIKKPILSLHVAAGNILIEAGKKVVQVITDPHVRYDYLNFADNPNMKFCVFDDATKIEFLEKAALQDKYVDPNKVIVTGPPIDPRIIATRRRKHPWEKGPIQLCITTGGLGTNKAEIEVLLKQLLPELRKRPSAYRVLVYAGTHKDIRDMSLKLAKENHISVSTLSHQQADFRVIYHSQIVNANELLLQYGFPWADGFISKPSGDMAYDAVGAGSFLLTLKEWGEWETNIRHRFEEKGISRVAVVDEIVTQLESLSKPYENRISWIEQAMINALNIEKMDPFFLDGAENITKVALDKK